MSKILYASLAILILTAKTTAASGPQIGYQAEFETVKSTGGDIIFNKLEVIDSRMSRENLTVKSSEITGDRTRVAQIEMSDFDVKNDDALRDCPELGGLLETVSVPAGTFKTCKTVRLEDGIKTEVWESTVPFVAVKSVRTLANGGTETRQLTGYGVR